MSPTPFVFFLLVSSYVGLRSVSAIRASLEAEIRLDGQDVLRVLTNTTRNGAESGPVAEDFKIKGMCPQSMDVADFYTFDKFTDKIGQGSFGAVYKAKSDKNEDVAVKDVFDTTSFRPVEIEPGRLGLPFNSEILEVFHPQESQVSLVSPLYGSGDLSKYMKKKVGADGNSVGLDADELHSFAAQLAYGIWQLHLKGFAHRDLKPANIMMHGKHLFIGDYGLVAAGCSPERPYCASGYAGSPYWMAPAQLQATRGYGPEVDWYAFGVIVYQLAVGLYSDDGFYSHPFPVPRHKSETAAWEQNVIAGQPDLSAISDPDLKSLLQKALRPDIQFLNDLYELDACHHPIMRASYFWKTRSSRRKFWKTFCEGFEGKDNCATQEGEQKAHNKAKLCKHNTTVNSSSIADHLRSKIPRGTDHCVGIDKIVGVVWEAPHIIMPAGDSKADRSFREWVNPRQIDVTSAKRGSPFSNDPCAVHVQMRKLSKGHDTWSAKSETFIMYCRSMPGRGTNLFCGDIDATTPPGTVSKKQYNYFTRAGVFTSTKKDMPRLVGMQLVERTDDRGARKGLDLLVDETPGRHINHPDNYAKSKYGDFQAYFKPQDAE